MASRSGSRGVSVQVKGAKELDAFFRDQIAKEDLNPAKRELRQGTKAIANDLVIPALKEAAAASPVPQAPKMAETARTRTDRFVTVRIGAVNPKLSGFKRGVGATKAKKGPSTTGRIGSKTSQDYRTTLAWGSDRGPYPGAKVNHYKVSRNEAGYWVRVGVGKAFPEVKRAYNELLGQILRDYGRYR